MKYCFIACALLVGLMADAQLLTLKDCVETAIKNNIEVKRAEWQSATGKVSWNQSKASQLPFVNAGISHGVNQGRSIDPFTNSYVNQEVSFANYSINSTVILWNGGNLRNTTQRDALSFEAGKMDVQQAKDNITVNVILAYLQVVNNEEQLELAKQQAFVTRQQVERLDVLNRQGAIAPATLYDLRGQLATDELNEINAKNNLENSKLVLAQLMNIDYSPAMKVEKIAIGTDPVLYADQPDAIYALASKDLAIVKASDLRKQVALKEISAAKGSRLPSVVLNAGLGTNYSSAASTLDLINVTDVATDDYVMISGTKVPVMSPQNNYSSRKISYGDQWKNNFNSGVSLGLRIPLLNGAQARSRINLAKIEQDRTLFESENIKTQLKQNIRQAYLNMTAAFERYRKLQQQVADFAESFKAAEVRFQAGVGTSVDYIIAKNNLDRARGNFIAAGYDYLLRTKVLDFYRGESLFK
jgi:outer membrane protein